MTARKATTRKSSRSKSTTAPEGLITAWSFSRWSTHEGCPKQAYYKYVEKLPDPSGPAAQRGTDIHGEAENYVNGTIKKLPESLNQFPKEFRDLRKGLDVRTEEQWAFTSSWRVTSWFAKDAWCRVKTDAAVVEEGSARIIDHKTGRIRDGYEKQLELYALSGFLKFPEVTEISGEIWYLDQGEIRDMIFTADEVPDLKRKWEGRTRAMLTATTFKERPGHACRWCSFSKKKGGPCKY